MNIKNDFQQIKEELNKDEKMLASIFKIEAFVKKNKFWLLGLLCIVLAVIIGYQTKEYLDEKRAMQVSALFAEIDQNGLDDEVLKKLEKESKGLYEFLIFNEAIKNQDKEDLAKLQNSANPFIAVYASYELGSLTQNFDSQKKYGDFKNLVLLQEGYMLTLKNEHQEALNKLNNIEPTSELREWALRIGHYGIAH